MIFLGPPGSGKGTYSTRLAGMFCIPHISTGDIFRRAILQNTALGKKVREYVKNGQLVPDDITIKILKERIGMPDCEKGFILDGFPRTISQAKALDELVDIDVVINLRIHEVILIKKLSGRRVCEKCGETYNIVNINETVEGVEYDMPALNPRSPGVCDGCGGRLIQRRDDRVDVIKMRLKLYRDQSMPLISYYRSRGLLEDVYVHLGIEKMIPIIVQKLGVHTGKASQYN